MAELEILFGDPFRQSPGPAHTLSVTIPPWEGCHGLGPALKGLIRSCGPTQLEPPESSSAARAVPAPWQQISLSYSQAGYATGRRLCPGDLHHPQPPAQRSRHQLEGSLCFNFCFRT